MQVHELAKLAGVKTAEMKAFLGVDSHLAKVSDEDIARAKENYTLSEAPQNTSDDKSRDGVIRLWSENKTHWIAARSGETIRMDNFQMTVEKDSDIYKEIKASGDAEVRVVIDKPFGSVAERTAFSKFLTERTITDQGKQSLYFGLDWIKGLFYPSELEEVATLLQDTGLVGVIQLAVDTKSYTTL